MLNIIRSRNLLFFAVFTIIVVIVITAIADMNRPLMPYQKLAQNSHLIVLGKVTSVDYKKGRFGEAGGKPYYATYQYVTINTEKVIKGIPRLEPLIIQSTAYAVGWGKSGK